MKIWKGEHWVGDAYHVEWGLKDTSCNLNLPSGDYEAYIDTTVGDEFQMSNVVAFTVKDGTILSVNASYSASDTEFSWVQFPYGSPNHIPENDVFTLFSGFSFIVKIHFVLCLFFI